MNTACCQHAWVKQVLQGDRLLWIRFKHLPPPAPCCRSSWKLFLHADRWLLIGQFGAGKFKPLLNETMLIIHSCTSAVQTSSWFCFLNLAHYELEWDVRSLVVIYTWHSPCRCSFGVHAPWLCFFSWQSQSLHRCLQVKINILTEYFFCYNNMRIQDSVNLFSPWLWF